MKLGNLIVPLLIALIIIYGLVKKVDVFEVFVEGAKDGLLVAFRILPVLVGLLTAIGMLRASGALDALTSLCAPLTKVLGAGSPASCRGPLRRPFTQSPSITARLRPPAPAARCPVR